MTRGNDVAATRIYLTCGWEIVAVPPDTITSPEDEAFQTLSWTPAPHLGTAASILRAAGTWNLSIPRRFDGEEWWYRVRLTAPADHVDGQPITLGFDGLATVAEVWLNGRPVLNSDNMFLSHTVRTTELQPGANELTLRFRALDAVLQAKRPRPRWRAPLVEHQQLRWLRTTLLGRMPGWSPPAAAVGPWRPIWMETAAAMEIEPPSIRTRIQGTTGVVRLRCRFRHRPATALARVELVLSRAGREHRGTLSHTEATPEAEFSGELAVENVVLWWPHTHGEPALYSARLEVHVDESGRAPHVVPLSRIGFRTILVDRADGNFEVQVNGERVFCRGVCWTPPDVVALDTGTAMADTAIGQLVAAGMNMVRVGGTMVYESDAFLDACDAQGVLLWQDFMFANMDYPENDSAFSLSVTHECTQQLRRLAGRPCIAVLCGNSEGEQQAAMWGTPRERWSHPIFHKLIPDLVRELAPQIPYWPSSAHGGAFPHQGNIGTTSYYGVGAYLLPVTDARRAEIRFATECLGFANVPEEEILTELGNPKAHTALWKSRVPRDLGAGWDFDDVRDHYFKEFYGLDPLTVRYAEHDRYLQMSRVVSGEIMGAAMREWRRRRSTCNGALIWFFRDLWPGAGWGITDAGGTPKAAYFALKRLLQPRTVFLTDEGGNGVFAHAVNESGQALEAWLEITLIPTDSAHPTRKRVPLALPARQNTEIGLVELLEGFSDLSYTYRFGPAPYEAIVASLLDTSESLIAQDVFFPQGHRSVARAELGLVATAHGLASGDAEVEVRAERLARFVSLRVPGFQAEDQYFHLLPGTGRRLHLRRTHATGDPKGEIAALNGPPPRKITLLTE